MPGLDHYLRVAAYRVDGASGLMAVTAFGAIPTSGDAFRFLYNEPIPSLQRRLVELTELLDRSLARLVEEAMKSG